MRALRLLTVAGLLLAALAASLASGQDAKFVEPEFTQCYDCHAPGLWTPPMDPVYAVFVSQVNPVVGQDFALQGVLLNTWEDEQLDMYVTLDISRAPSLSFATGRDPLLGQEHEGAIEIDARELNQRQRSPGVRVEVPAGATDVRLTLTPSSQSAQTGPDLTLVIRDALGQETRVNDAGKGAPEVFQRTGAGAVAAHGFGNWTIYGEVQPVIAGASPVVDPQFTTVPFTVTLDAWFNTTGETQQVVYRPGPVQPGARELFSWNLRLGQVPGQGERIELIANATTHYDHTGGEPDWENMTINSTAPFQILPDGTPQIGIDPQGSFVQPRAPVGVTMAAISEAIGYAAAFLLITSIYTGGIFGKTTRRQLNAVFGSARRRVAFHNFLSYGIIAAAVAHMVIFVWDTIEPNYPWQLGLIWGGIGILCMLALGVTGAIQVPMIRRWNYATWRWTHFALAIGAIVFTIVHILLDGTHFGEFQQSIGWKDPLVPETRQA